MIYVGIDAAKMTHYAAVKDDGDNVAPSQNLCKPPK